MNVTNDRFKDRQLHIEDYLQMVWLYTSHSQGVLRTFTD